MKNVEIVPFIFTLKLKNLRNKRSWNRWKPYMGFYMACNGYCFIIIYFASSPPQRSDSNLVIGDLNFTVHGLLSSNLWKFKICFKGVLIIMTMDHDHYFLNSFLGWEMNGNSLHFTLGHEKKLIMSKNRWESGRESCMTRNG